MPLYYRVTSWLKLTCPSNNRVTTLPEVISKSYRADVNVKADEDAAEIKIPIDPETGEVVPLLPLKFKPVPSAANELDNIA